MPRRTGDAPTEVYSIKCKVCPDGPAMPRRKSRHWGLSPSRAPAGYTLYFILHTFPGQAPAGRRASGGSRACRAGPAGYTLHFVLYTSYLPAVRGLRGRRLVRLSSRRSRAVWRTVPLPRTPSPIIRSRRDLRRGLGWGRGDVLYTLYSILYTPMGPRRRIAYGSLRSAVGTQRCSCWCHRAALSQCRLCSSPAESCHVLGPVGC